MYTQIAQLVAPETGRRLPRRLRPLLYLLPMLSIGSLYFGMANVSRAVKGAEGATVSSVASTRVGPIKSKEAPGAIEWEHLRVEVERAVLDYSESGLFVLAIELAVTNTQQTLKFDAFEFPMNRTWLTDEHRNNYRPAPDQESQVMRGSLYPGETVRIRLEYEPPIASSQKLDFKCAVPSRPNLHQQLHFRIPAGQIEPAKVGQTKEHETSRPYRVRAVTSPTSLNLTP